MKKTKKKTSNLQILVGSILALMIGAYLPFLYFLGQTPDYNMLEESSIVVNEVWYERGNNRGLSSVDGVKYSIRGEYNRSVVDEVLTEGTEITIKWYERKLLTPKKLFIEEIQLEGKVICEYTNHNLTDMVFIIISCGLMIGIGFFGLWYYKKLRG